MHNTSPGPAAGHGLGCVSCHKSACSFAGKSNKGKGQGKKSKLSIASTDSDCDDE
jgi:hypothetical protein